MSLDQNHVFREGRIAPFAQYLAEAQKRRTSPLAWSANAIRSAIETMSHGERGTLALINSEMPETGAIAPGLSLAVQVVRRGQSTSAHAHSFWHMYVVQSGSGYADFGDPEQARKIRTGDVLLFPAWCAHAFRNADADEDLVLLCLQNLPECARIGNLVRQDASGDLSVVYASHSDAAR